MTDHYDAAELEALAADPRTDWDILHWIAENYPELRPAVAANPGAYQELVDALGQLGDPAIDAAIALRHRGRDVSSEAAATNPLAGMYDTLTQNIPAYQPASDHYVDYDPVRGNYGEPYAPEEQEQAPEYPVAEDPVAQTPVAEDQAAEAPAVEEPEGVTETEPPTGEVPVTYWDGPVDQEPSPADEHVTELDAEPVRPPNDTDVPEDSGYGDPVPAAAVDSAFGVSSEENSAPRAYPAAAAHSLAASAPPAASAAYTPRSAASPTPAATAAPERKRGAAAPKMLMVAAVILGLAAVGALITMLIGFLGGEEQEQVAEPAPAPTEAPEETEGGEENGEPPEEEESPEVDTAVLEETRTAVAGLPGQSSCASGDDAAVIAAFLEAGATDEAFPGDDDLDMLEDTFSDLQSECSATHAAGVFESARSGSEAPAEQAGEILTEVGTGWVDRAIGLGGAEQMESFSIHDGNIQCVFEDGVTCTVYDATHSAPSGCSEATTYRMHVEGGSGEPDCGNPVEESDRESLGDNELATDGFLACINISNRISCYNTLNGAGFELSEIGHYGTSP